MEVLLTGKGMTGQLANDDLHKKFVAYTDNPDGVILDRSVVWTERDVASMDYKAVMKLTVEPFKQQKGPDYLGEGWRAKHGPQESNKSGFRACGHRVLLSPEEVEKKSEGGILLVEKTVVAQENMAVICTVLEIGHDCWSDKSTDYCQVGDRVLVGMYTGKFHISPVDGKKYRFVMDTDVISPLPKEPA